MANGSAEFLLDSVKWKQLLDRLRLKIKNITTTKEFANLISLTVYRDIIEHFEKEVGPGGKKWDQWSKSYKDAIDGKVAFRYSKKTGGVYAFDPSKSEYKIKPPRKPGLILQSSGKLRNSFKPSKFKLSDGAIVFYNNAKTSDGFPYAQHHDEGRSSWKGNSRTFMYLSAIGMKRIIDQATKWALEDFNGTD